MGKGDGKGDIYVPLFDLSLKFIPFNIYWHTVLIKKS
jgi:hypothetical protein